MKVFRLGALAATAAIVLAACGGGASPAPSVEPGASAAPSAAADKGTVEVWSELPRQGSSKEQTDTIVNAIKLALDERGGKIHGWTIKYTDQDDSTAEAGKWTQERATALATEAAGNDDLVGYIGTFNSGAAKIVIPVLCQSGIPMVSPANTYPGLTKPGKGEAGEPEKYYPGGCTHNYYRVIPADDLQGFAAAQWAKDLGATKVYVLDDTEIYGKGVADVFDASAKEIGLTVLGHDQAPGKSTDFKALAAKIAAAGPDLVFYGGITQNNAGQLWKDLKDAMPSVKLMGPDGIAEDAFLTAAGAAAEGTYVTFGGVDPEKYTGKAAEFKANYEAKYPGSGLQAYTIYGYEAASVLFAAIETASTGGATDVASLRTGTLAALAATKDFPGVTGTFSLDANGDTSSTVFTGFLVTGGKFEFSKVLGE